MRKTLGGIAAIAVLAAAFGGIATAEAKAPAKPQSSVLGPVRIDPNDASVAYVTARYMCSGGTTEETHLWVSVKQSADGGMDTALSEEGSSAIAGAYSQSHPEPGVGFVCDDKWHVQTFTVDQTELTPWSPLPVGFGTLQPGQAWIQFCLFDGYGQPSFTQRFGAIQ